MGGDRARRPLWSPPPPEELESLPSAALAREVSCSPRGHVPNTSLPSVSLCVVIRHFALVRLMVRGQEDVAGARDRRPGSRVTITEVACVSPPDPPRAKKPFRAQKMLLP